jgi:hypothetical protein
VKCTSSRHDVSKEYNWLRGLKLTGEPRIVGFVVGVIAFVVVPVGRVFLVLLIGLFF